MQLSEKNKLVITILILLITLLWGYAWVAMKEALMYMGPFTFTSLRFGLGTFVLFILIFISKRSFPIKIYWKALMVQGILQTAIVFLLVMYGLKFVEAGKSSVLLYSMPVWSSLLAAKLLKERITGTKIIGLLLGLIGIFTILGWDIWLQQDLFVIFGELLIIVAAISWAVSNVYFRIHLGHLPKLETSAYQMLFGTLVIIIVTSFTEWNEPIIWHAQSVYYVLFTGIFASALCFTIWYIILTVIDMVTATISTQLVPIFGLIFSAFLLDEALTVGVLMGAGLIMIGIVIVQLKSEKENST